MSTGSVRVSRDDLDTMAILRQSMKRDDQMRRSNTSYGRTTSDMNDVGLYGEHAVHHWLSGLTTGVSMPAPDDYSDGDIHVHWPPTRHQPGGVLLSLEVKTSRHSAWEKIGRCLHARQLKAMSSRAVVWCVVADELPTASVDIMGWLPTDAARDSDGQEPLVIHGQPHVRVTTPMRQPEELVAWLNTEAAVSGIF